MSASARDEEILRLVNDTKRGRKFPYILCRIGGVDAVICE